jgi:hypothetical protein
VHAERDTQSTDLFASDGTPLTYDQLLKTAPPSIQAELTPEKWRARFQACQRAIAKEAEIVERVIPDALIIVGDDQQEVIKDDNMPAMLIYWGKTIPHVPASLITALHSARWAYGEEEKELSDDIVLITRDQASLDIGQYLYELIGVALPMKRLLEKHQKRRSLLLWLRLRLRQLQRPYRARPTGRCRARPESSPCPTFE